MALTYEPIATATASGSSATFSFTSISSSYTDLRVVFCGGQTSDAPVYLRFNGDDGSNYWTKTINAYGSSIDAQRGNLGGIWTRSEGAVENDLFGSITFEIPSYRSSNYKTTQTRPANQNVSPVGLSSFAHGLWKTTSAITQIDLVTATGNWYAGSTATLYGILRA